MIKNLICIDIKKESRSFHLVDSVGNNANISTAEDLFNFLLIDADKPDTAKVCWNLFQLFNVISSLLPSTITDKIIKDDRAFFGDYKIFSSSGKVISIGYTKKLHDNFYDKRIEQNIYGLRQYFPNDNVASLNGLSGKANELMQTLNELGWEINSLSSPIAIYDSVLDKQYIPTIYTMPDTPEADELLDMAYKMMCRENRTIFKVGNFLDTYHYDICGSYPSIIKDFYDTDDCQVWKSDSFQKADFGIVEGTIDITSDYCPIVSATGENRKGKYDDVFTTEQIGFLYHYGQGTFKIKNGLYVNFNKDIQPFNELMENLYSIREFGGPKKDLSKGISVGIYGRMSEEHPEKYGKYFHPLYSVLTTSRSSIKVSKFILDNHLEKDLIAIIVDGCMATKEVPCPNNKEFGSWRCDKTNSLVLSIGHLYFDGKKDANLNSYQSMMDAIKKSPNKSIYGDVLINKNLMVTHRNFQKFPKSGKDLIEKIYESVSIIVGEK